MEKATTQACTHALTDAQTDRQVENRMGGGGTTIGQISWHFVIHVSKRSTYLSVCLWICLLDTLVYPAKTDQLTEVPFGMWPQVVPRNHVQGVAKSIGPNTNNNFNNCCRIQVILGSYYWVNMPLKDGLISHLNCEVYVPYHGKL